MTNNSSGPQNQTSLNDILDAFKEKADNTLKLFKDILKEPQETASNARIQDLSLETIKRTETLMDIYKTKIKDKDISKDNLAYVTSRMIKITNLLNDATIKIYAFIGIGGIQEMEKKNNYTDVVNAIQKATTLEGALKVVDEFLEGFSLPGQL